MYILFYQHIKQMQVNNINVKCEYKEIVTIYIAPNTDIGWSDFVHMAQINDCNQVNKPNVVHVQSLQGSPRYSYEHNVLNCYWPHSERLQFTL